MSEIRLSNRKRGKKNSDMEGKKGKEVVEKFKLRRKNILAKGKVFVLMQRKHASVGKERNQPRLNY